jgi:endonuclease/exonuclease/phosphatase family metal-dependent hydrolase
MRLCTLNVHDWVDGVGRGNCERIEALLTTLDCDVVALQEVSRGSEVERVAEALKMHVQRAPAWWADNVLLTRARPRWSGAIELDAGPGELRSAAIAGMDTEFGVLVVAATHLDHIAEHRRVRQFEILEEALRVRGEAAFVLGDFNALRRSDYEPARWDAIDLVRARNEWESPREDLIREMDTRGWIDLVRLHLASSLEAYTDALATPLPTHLARTSRFDTRIDYVMASRTLAPRLSVSAVEVVDTDASDHRPVVVDVCAA